MKNNKKKNKIETISLDLKKKILEISYKKKAHHIGSCLSCIDILTALYFGFMKVKNNQIKKNDRFIMSKGHAALSYYLVLMKLKFFSEKFLLNEYLTNNGKLGGHPDMNIKLGIDFSSGSLGNGISVAAGMAYAHKADKQKNKVFTLIGDGECNEGSVWEAAMSAAHYDLNQLTVIIDRNNFQQTGKSDEIMSYKNLKNIWSSFGFLALEVNGHNINELTNAFNTTDKKKPKVIIANTIKGKGLSFMENDNNWHHSILTSKLYEKAMEELK